MPLDNLTQAPVGDLEILIDARSRISGQNSWVQGRFADGERRCLVAALSQACESRSFSVPNKIERRLARMLARQLPAEAPWRTKTRLVSARRRLMAFNDCPRTARHDVLALFDRTIRDLMQKVPEYASA